MRTLIVIPARMAAQRLPNKPLAVLGGVPLVVRVAQQARHARLASDVLIATDSSAVVDAAAHYGFRAVLTRPDHACGTERVGEAARSDGAEWVINLQGDEPFVHPKDIDAVAELLRAPGTDWATLAFPLSAREQLLSPNVVKVVTDDAGRALYFSRAPIPYDRAERHEPQGAWGHVGLYGYTRTALERYCAAPPHPLERRESLEQLRALALGMTIRVGRAQGPTRGIDTPDDLRWAQNRIDKLGDAAFPNYTGTTA